MPKKKLKCCHCQEAIAEDASRYVLQEAAYTICSECGHKHKDGHSQTWLFCSGDCLREFVPSCEDLR